MFGIRYPNTLRTASVCTGRENRIPLHTMTISPATGSYVPPAPLAEQIADEWMLDQSIVFLNHGCFGARPRCVSMAQQRWRERLENRPIELLDRRRDDLLQQAKQVVGRFLNVQPQDFGFVSNATGGVNAVLRSLQFQSGDELLTVNHVYNAVRQAMVHVASISGAISREQPVPLPVNSQQQLVDAIASALTDKTRLVIVDHVTSPTALVFPVRQIVALCEKHGVDVLVDGAHAPGMVETDLEAIGAAYYTANLHKWACAPLGTAFLWVREDRQQGIHPNTISHFYGESLAEEFAWQGTRDISGWLSAVDALAYMEHYGWEKVRAHNHKLTVWMQAMLCDTWGIEPSSPLDGSMIGSMATMRLPQSMQRAVESAEHLHNRLYDEFSIEVPIFEWDDAWWIRPSCQIYNLPEHYERLGDAVLKILA